MKSTLKNTIICFIALIMNPMFCISQNYSREGWDWATDTLTYKEGNKKRLFVIARRAENFKRAFKDGWVKEKDWKTVGISDTICYITCLIELVRQTDGSYYHNWHPDSDEVWRDIFLRYLGNAFWTSPHPFCKSNIEICMEKGRYSYGITGGDEEIGQKRFFYRIKCTKVRILKSDTTRKLCVFKFYQGYNPHFNSYRHFFPFPSGKLVYLHNIGFIHIKVPHQKSLRLKSINGYPWRKYINKINPNYRYFYLKSNKYLR